MDATLLIDDYYAENSMRWRVSIWGPKDGPYRVQSEVWRDQPDRDGVYRYQLAPQIRHFHTLMDAQAYASEIASDYRDRIAAD